VRDPLTSALHESRHLTVRDQNKVPDTLYDAAEARAAYDAHPGGLKALRKQRLDGFDGSGEWRLEVFRHKSRGIGRLGRR
jgi:hypothetical protein